MSQVHQPSSFRGCICLKCTNHVVLGGAPLSWLVHLGQVHPLKVPLQVHPTNEKSRTSISKFCSFQFLLLLVGTNSVIKHIRTDRRRHLHRPAQTSAPTDADIRIDRRRRPHRPTQMLQVAMCFCQSSLQFCSSYPSNGSFLFSAF